MIDELTKLLKKRDSDLSRAEKALLVLWGDVDGYEIMAAEAMEEVAQLQEFAKRYGSHLPNCPNPYKRECECGFNQDRAALKGI